jgi:hypothetical protein
MIINQRMRHRFSYQFCDLLNINHEYEYPIDTILKLLISYAITKTKNNYKFNNGLYYFLNSILAMPSIGYYRKDLIKIINIISISDKKTNEYLIINDKEREQYIENIYIEL